jgi:undecaprenyl-diphosphatase
VNGDEREQPDERATRDSSMVRIPPVPRVGHNGVPLALSCAAIVLVFIGLLEFDLPVVRYLRLFTTHSAGEALTVPWMAWVSDAGDWVGEGSRLVAVSAVLLIAGWSFSKPTVTSAAVETLLAHGIAALLSNGLKHLLGRPRPKFVHSGEWQFTPSWASGWDSFPSGHTTASFAVAAVLARRFPSLGPFCYGVAIFVGLSRVIRGSHFPTDVFGGAVLGLLSGSLASAPWTDWRASIRDGLRHAAVGAVAAFALLWALARPADGGTAGAAFTGLGAAAVASGLWLRRAKWSAGERLVTAWEDKASRALIGYGLAAMTTAPLVVAAAGLACLALMLGGADDQGPIPPTSHVRSMVGEAVLVGSVGLAVLILVEGRGVLPLS